MYNNGRKDILEPDDLEALHELTLERGQGDQQFVHMTFSIRPDREPFAEGEQPNFLIMTNGVATKFFSPIPRPAAPLADVAPEFTGSAVIDATVPTGVAAAVEPAPDPVVESVVEPAPDAVVEPAPDETAPRFDKGDSAKK